MSYDQHTCIILNRIISSLVCLVVSIITCLHNVAFKDTMLNILVIFISFWNKKAILTDCLNLPRLVLFIFIQISIPCAWLSFWLQCILDQHRCYIDCYIRNIILFYYIVMMTYTHIFRNIFLLCSPPLCPPNIIMITCIITHAHYDRHDYDEKKVGSSRVIKQQFSENVRFSWHTFDVNNWRALKYLVKLDWLMFAL